MRDLFDLMGLLFPHRPPGNPKLQGFAWVAQLGPSDFSASELAEIERLGFDPADMAGVAACLSAEVDFSPLGEPGPPWFALYRGGGGV